MDHLTPYASRTVHALAPVAETGWRLKRYGLLADGQTLDAEVVNAATQTALRRLPEPGALANAKGNHGCGFQIIHFAQTAIVSPVFYWQWGSVLSSLTHLRASLKAPKVFDDGYAKILGCVWELEIIAFENQAWKDAVLTSGHTAPDPIGRYLNVHIAGTKDAPGPTPEPEAKG